MADGQVGFGHEFANDFFPVALEGSLLFRSSEPPCRTVMKHGERKAAMCCSSCETVVITRNEMIEVPCLQCGEILGPGIAVCPKCGWTYQTNTEPP